MSCLAAPIAGLRRKNVLGRGGVGRGCKDREMNIPEWHNKLALAMASRDQNKNRFTLTLES